MTREAARQVHEAAGGGPDDVDVVELHDCFTADELISQEALGLCPEGGAERYIRDDANTHSGKHVTNPPRWTAVQRPRARGDGTGAMPRADPATARRRRREPEAAPVAIDGRDVW